MKFVDLFDWENSPLCRRIGIFIDEKPISIIREVEI